MKFDDLGLMIMEHVAHPGSIGDSCAETARHQILVLAARGELLVETPLRKFITESGYLRHPTSPWREDDFSNDQALPLLMAFDLSGLTSDAERMRSRSRFRIFGSKAIMSAGMFALVHRWFWILNLVNVIQGLLFMIPWRWSDDDRLKGKIWKFERSQGSSADWLNFAITFIYLRLMAKRATMIQPRHRILAKVKDYYRVEPNPEWISGLYDEALRKTQV